MRFVIYTFGNPGLAVWAAEGLQALGHETVDRNAVAWQPSYDKIRSGEDAAVTPGIAGPMARIGKFWSEAGKPVITMDLPHLRVQGYWRVVLRGMDWRPPLAGQAPAGRYRRLGLKDPVQGRRTKAQRVLLLGQTSNDGAHGMDAEAFLEWAADARDRIRAMDPKARIIWRPHPLEPKLHLEDADEYSDPGRESLATVLGRCWLTVTYNSTAGLESLIAGVPVIAEGPSIYGEVAVGFGDDHDVKPPDPERVKEMLNMVAYTQWTTAEIRSGEAFGPVLAAILGEPYTPKAEPEPELEGDTDGLRGLHDSPGRGRDGQDDGSGLRAGSDDDRLAGGRNGDDGAVGSGGSEAVDPAIR